MGFGCMSLTGPFYHGEGLSEEQAVAVLHRALDLGVALFNTSDLYGPYTNEELLGASIPCVDACICVRLEPDAEAGPCLPGAAEEAVWGLGRLQHGLRTCDWRWREQLAQAARPLLVQYAGRDLVDLSEIPHRPWRRCPGPLVPTYPAGRALASHPRGREALVATKWGPMFKDGHLVRCRLPWHALLTACGRLGSCRHHAALPSISMQTGWRATSHHVCLLQVVIRRKLGLAPLAPRCPAAHTLWTQRMDASPANCRACCEGSLKRLGRDCIDLFTMRGPVDPKVGVGA